ncbi:hypothetical protein UCREL1_695 [Eutypa lata UCREL1]|uniref:Uncharacterized protein n=1 Tax=Eutypa lata (strain UCR-EL1) TaxID=1287681 RepID=M7T6J1_EUTLA|nr:hypothetical protein UCREL1_695 [Eutypa lata UCREL1]
MDRNLRRVLSIFFAIYMSLYVLGLIHFGVFLQLKLAPYFREHSTELEAGTAELLFGFLYIAALYLTLWLPSILKPACPRSLIEKLYSYKHTEYIAMTVGSDSESQRRRMVGLVSEDLRLEDIEAQRRARMSRVRF